MLRLSLSWHQRVCMAGRTLQKTLLSTSVPSPTFYDSTIEKVAAAPLQKMSLAEMLSIGQAALKDDSVLLEHARFVQTELPKRLAKRLLDLRFLPHIVITNPHIQRVYDAYYKALGILLALKEIRTKEQNVEFTAILKELLDEQTQLLNAFSSGLKECLVKKSIVEKVNLQPFVEGILRSRISRRVMAQHHVGLHDRREGFIGCISTDLNVNQAIESAAQESQSVCKQFFGACPEVEIEDGHEVLMPYIPAHVEYMFSELFKNSMRAQMERSVVDVPKIRVKLSASHEVVTARISDEGGGIPSEILDRVWQYGYSTTNKALAHQGASSFGSFWLDTQQKMTSGLSGHGFGLPFTRLYARYFGGDLQLVSVPGFGVDCFLTMKKLDRHAWSENVEPETSEPLVYTGVEISRGTA